MRSTKSPPRIDATARQRDISALAEPFTPIAKLCMKSGMGAGELQIAVKLACINVAAESAKLGNRLNHSRIAAATGLTRKDVRTLFALVKSGGGAVGREVAKQRTTRVLQGWRTDPEYVDRNGHPITLIIRGPGLTFHTLVKRYGGDVTPISVLNELVRTGAVAITGNSRVEIRKTTPRVKGYGSEVVATVANRLRDFTTTLVANIERHKTPIFIGFHEILGLSEDEAALFHATFAGRAASLVDGVVQWRASQSRLRSRDASKAKSGVRVGLGVFLIGPLPQQAAKAKSEIRRRTRR